MYTYKLRPGYGSTELLLEFVAGSEEDNFLNELFSTFSPLNFKTEAIDDLWVNDEYIFHISSLAGEFELTKDIWNFVFILATNNQPGIKILDEYLLKSDKFEKLDVDFSQYTNISGE